jgi:hypothetical protein
MAAALASGQQEEPMRLVRLAAPATLTLALFAAPLTIEAQPADRVYRVAGCEETGRWAERLGVTLNLHGVARPEDIQKTFAAMRAARPDALMSTADLFVTSYRSQVVEFADRNGSPPSTRTGTS